MTRDVANLTAPEPSGREAARAIELALADAELGPGDVDYVNAHGTSTPLNDRSETEALKASLGDEAYRIPVSSTKSAIGHLLGAAGGLTAVRAAHDGERRARRSGDAARAARPHLQRRLGVRRRSARDRRRDADGPARGGGGGGRRRRGGGDRRSRKRGLRGDGRHLAERDLPAVHLTAPEPSGREAARAIELALADAELGPGDVDYVNAHGTSTPLNDRSETEALKASLGDEAYRIPVSSTKSAIGHLLGAAGAVEAVATTATLRAGTIAPTLGYEEPDEGLDLDYVPRTGRPVERRENGGGREPLIALSNSFGFGGHNAVLCLAVR